MVHRGKSFGFVHIDIECKIFQYRAISGVDTKGTSALK